MIGEIGRHAGLIPKNGLTMMGGNWCPEQVRLRNDVMVRIRYQLLMLIMGVLMEGGNKTHQIGEKWGYRMTDGPVSWFEFDSRRIH